MTLFLSVFAIFLLFHVSADALGSDRGQWGLLVGGAVVCATIAAERLCFGTPLRLAPIRLGLGRPAARGLAAAGAIGVLLFAVIPAAAQIIGVPIALRPRWILLVPGLCAQAGIAEEILFRGYLFGHIRSRRSFSRACLVAAVPFTAVHLVMFATMPWPVAAAAVALATIATWPLSYAYELGGGTIWAPAILHTVMQGGLKVIDYDSQALLFLWIGACAILPLAVFLVSRPAREYATMRW